MLLKCTKILILQILFTTLDILKSVQIGVYPTEVAMSLQRILIDLLIWFFLPDHSTSRIFMTDDSSGVSSSVP